MGRAAAALAAVLVLTFASCGDDSGDAGDGEGTEETDTGGGGENDAGEFDVVEADQRVAEAALLTLDDLDGGWEQDDDPSDGGGEVFEVMRGIEGCESEAERGLDLRSQRTARASSEFFGMSGREGVENSVTIFGDEALAQEAFASQFSDCGTEASEEGLEQLPGASGVTLSEPESVDLGDEALTVRVEATAEDPESGTPMDLIIDIVTVRTGRGLATVIFAYTADVDPPLVQTGAVLVETVVGRLAAELA
jgi:hypothetical protein